MEYTKRGSSISRISLWVTILATSTLVVSCSRSMPVGKGALTIQLPAGWHLEHNTPGGLDFYMLKTSPDGGGSLMFSKWPPRSGPKEIPALVRKLADGFVERSKDSTVYTLRSEKYEVEPFAGDHCQGSFARFRIASGDRDMLQVMFMMTVEGQVWNGQFTGKPDDWSTALGLLKALKPNPLRRLQWNP